MCLAGPDPRADTSRAGRVSCPAGGRACCHCPGPGKPLVTIAHRVRLPGTGALEVADDSLACRRVAKAVRHPPAGIAVGRRVARRFVTPAEQAHVAGAGTRCRVAEVGGSNRRYGTDPRARAHSFDRRSERASVPARGVCGGRTPRRHDPRAGPERAANSRGCDLSLLLQPDVAVLRRNPGRPTGNVSLAGVWGERQLVLAHARSGAVAACTAPALATRRRADPHQRRYDVIGETRPET